MTEPQKSLQQIQIEAQANLQDQTASPPVRRRRARLFESLLMISLVAFGGLAYVVNTAVYFSVDLAITNLLQSLTSPWFQQAMIAISWPGFPPQVVILTALVVLSIYLSGLRWEAAVALIVGFGVQLLNMLMKILIQRPRPTTDLVDVIQVLNSYSFPSGHVMYYTAFFGFMFFLSYTLLKYSARRSLLLTGLGALIGLVGVSRIYLGQHWASDVLGAYILGGVTLAVAIVIYRNGKGRWFTDQPVASEP